MHCICLDCSSCLLLSTSGPPLTALLLHGRDVKGQIASTHLDLRQAQTDLQASQAALTAARREHEIAKQVECHTILQP